MNNLGKIAIAAAAGTIVGGVLGILFAPDKGIETRKKIVDGGKKMTDTFKKKIDENLVKINRIKTNLTEKADKMKEKVEEFA
jgi:gas vesicle protein